jgi:hypothetical protein
VLFHENLGAQAAHDVHSQSYVDLADHTPIADLGELDYLIPKQPFGARSAPSREAIVFSWWFGARKSLAPK